ncbi:MAG: oligosaccharide flippase family protein [Schwartzia sp.]|nr:oligosaccharide flippase family protein [Schwartzia sp. (in: firmicutes)]
MSKAKLFIENFLVYGLGGIISKIIPFVMVPLVTRMMPGTFYFGLNDLISTITSFASAFAIMGMYDAMYRMFFDRMDEDFKKAVCSTTLVFACGMAAVVASLLVLFRESIGALFFEDAQYAYLVCFSAMATLVGATNSIVSAPTRMQNQRRVFLVANTVGPLLSYGIAIPLLLHGYYVLALPLAGIVSGIAMEASFFLLNRHWFSPRFFDASLLKQLLALAVPMMPTFLLYWIFNSCDRVMIAQMLDVGQVGIYSVGAKLGHASQLIYTAFAGGWQYFAFSTMKDENQVESNSAIYEYLGAVSFLAGMWMCGLVRPLFAWLFPPDYLSGYIVAPYLFLAPLLLMLYQVAGNQFLVVKKTGRGFWILCAGALSNVAGNLFLIPRLGIEGAALATLFGYIVLNIFCAVLLCRMRLMVVSKRFFVIVGITVAYFAIWRLWLYGSPHLGLGLAFAASAGFAVLYKRELAIVAARAKGVIAAR